MTKNARDLEIVVAIFLILFSIAYFYLLLEVMSVQLDFFRKVLQHPEELVWYNLLVVWYIPILINFMFFLSGFGLIFSKRIGWYLASIYAIYATIFSAIFPTLYATSDDTLPEFEYNWLVYVISGCFLLISVFLFSNQVRKKYLVNRKSLVVVLIGTMLLLVNHIV